MGRQRQRSIFFAEYISTPKRSRFAPVLQEARVIIWLFKSNVVLCGEISQTRQVKNTFVALKVPLGANKVNCNFSNIGQ
jgi:hypothetical protein